ncbi:Hypothetical predicted protein [Cloeon dipterum]|uniref:Condensin complex subunit 1 n=1 Tax=Cloeon dipterum TaxID=197152 RepID=A0A8S1CTN7_9INSE|nr:Hypothetical predicted protein [Cloeon dipterum]
MEEAEFIIPHGIDELLEFNENQYSVQDVLTPVEIREQYTGLRLVLSEDLSDFIFGKFDLLYSCIKNFQQLSPKVTLEVWDQSLKAFGLQVSNLRPFLEKGNIDSNIREKLLRNTKMILYVCTELMYKFEERCISERELASKLTKGKKKGAQHKDFNWDEEKTSGIHELFKLVSLPLKNLWKKANISDDFLDQISRICLKLLEDREIGFVGKKAMRDSIFQILSVLCKEYIFGLSLIPRLLQLLMLHEHLAVPLASSISNLEQSGGNAGLLHLILTEIEGDSDITPKAGSHFGSFVVALSQQHPASLVPHIEILADIAESEPYTLRTGILEATKNLLLQLYSSQELDENQKSENEALLEILDNHLIDVNAYARCKALQGWTSLCEAEMLPVKLLLDILEKAVERTLDKSSYVRKDALKFLKTCLEHNPFSGNLDKEKIGKQLEAATAKLIKLQGNAGVADFSVEEVWETIGKRVQIIVHKALAQDLADKENEPATEKVAEENKEESDKENKSEEDKYEKHAEEMEKELQEGLLKAGNLLLDEKLEEAVQLALELTKKMAKNEENAKDDNEDLQADLMCTLLKAALTAVKPETADIELPKDVQVEIKKKKETIQFLKNCLQISTLIGVASENVRMLLATSQTTDLVEAIDFIASAQQFGLLSEEDSALKLLEFLHSKDLALKKAVTDACKKIYLSSIDPEYNVEITFNGYVEAMKKISSMVHNARPCFSKSIALLVQTWVNHGSINNECLFALWEMVESKNKSECVPALHTLSIALAGKPNLVQEKIATLDKIGFGSRGEGCFELAKWAAAVLCHATPKITAETLTNPFRIPFTDDIFTHISNLLIKGVFKLGDKDYCGLAGYFVKAIFKTCLKPLSLIEEILRKMHEEVRKYNPADYPENKNNSTDAEEEREDVPLTQLATQETDAPPTQPTDTPPLVESISHVVLLRYVYVIGLVVEELHTFIYEDIMAEIRRQKTLVELERNRQRMRRSRANTTASSGQDDDEDGSLFDIKKLMHSSSKYFINNTEEENLDALLRLCDNEVLFKDNLLGKLLTFVQDCFTSRHCHHHGLRIVAIQTFGKYMQLSPNFCSKNLLKFVTILAKSKDSRVKIACIHTLGDLLKKFPNQCEPYSPFVYDCLKESDSNVRFEALVVISKLILSDMIRVKFQISSLARCLTDTDMRCQDLARYFFATLAKKGNILYNLVLDMISQLSIEYSESNQTSFEEIMNEILPHIDKDKQVVALVEKLSSRFKDKAEEVECYNLALCISKLPVTAKSVHAFKEALMESLPHYADKLKYPTVKSKFDEIVQMVRKQMKAEGKDECEKWQEVLDSCAKGKDSAKLAIAGLAEAVQVEPKEKRKAKAPRGRRKARKDSSSDDDGEAAVAAPKTPRAPRSQRKKVVDSDDDDSIIQTAARHKRKPAAKTPATRKQAILEEDEEEIQSPVKQRRVRGKKIVESD